MCLAATVAPLAGGNPTHGRHSGGQTRPASSIYRQMPGWHLRQHRYSAQCTQQHVLAAKHVLHFLTIDAGKLLDMFGRRCVCVYVHFGCSNRMRVRVFLRFARLLSDRR